MVSELHRSKIFYLFVFLFALMADSCSTAQPFTTPSIDPNNSLQLLIDFPPHPTLANSSLSNSHPQTICYYGNASFLYFYVAHHLMGYLMAPCRIANLQVALQRLSLRAHLLTLKISSYCMI